MAEAKMILGYWGIKGKVQAVRDFLEYLGLPYENKIYNDPVEWFEKDKPAFLEKNPFANLPYLIDGEKLIACTDALFHYLAHKAGKPALSTPLTIEEITNFATYRSFFSTLLEHVVKAATSPDSEIALEYFKKELTPLLERIAKHLSTNNWIAGANITYLDFQYYEIFKGIYREDPNLLNENIKKYITCIEDIPQIKTYLGSDRYPDIPFGPPNVVFLQK
jgi:glutathione S-transferase